VSRGKGEKLFLEKNTMVRGSCPKEDQEQVKASKGKKEGKRPGEEEKKGGRTFKRSGGRKSREVGADLGGRIAQKRRGGRKEKKKKGLLGVPRQRGEASWRVERKRSAKDRDGELQEKKREWIHHEAGSDNEGGKKKKKKCPIEGKTSVITRSPICGLSPI